MEMMDRKQTQQKERKEQKKIQGHIFYVFEKGGSSIIIYLEARLLIMLRCKTAWKAK